MWQGILTDEQIEGIASRLPDVKSFQANTAKLSPDMISLHMISTGGDQKWAVKFFRGGQVLGILLFVGISARSIHLWVG